MTLFGVIWLVAAIVALFDRRIETIVLFWMVSMVLQCDNVLYLGEAGVGPQLLASIILIIKSFAFSSPRNVMHFDLRCVACVLVFACVIVSSALGGVLTSAALKICQLMFYMIAFVRLLAMGRFIRRQRLVGLFEGVTAFVAIWGAFQFAISAGAIPRSEVVTALFYNDSSTDIYYNINYSLRLYSTFMEPSYCVCFLTGAFYFLLIVKREKAALDKLLLIVLLAEILATRSTTGYIAFAVLAVIHIVIFRDKNALAYLIPEVVVMVVALILNPDLLQSVVFSKLSSGSASVRTQWNNVAISNFLSSPVFGVGYKQSRASSLAFSLLAELGLVGFCSYLLMLVSILFSGRKMIGRGARGAISLVFAVAICQIIACPDLDFCVFWMAMGVYGLYAGSSVSDFGGRIDFDETRKDDYLGLIDSAKTRGRHAKLLSLVETPNEDEGRDS